MKQKVIRAGKHSLSVVIPSMFVHALGLHAGDECEVNPTVETGQVMYQFKGSMQLPLIKTRLKKSHNV